MDTELWDAKEIAEWRGMVYCGAHKWIERKGLRPVGVSGHGRHKRDLFSAAEVRAAHHGIEPPVVA